MPYLIFHVLNLNENQNSISHSLGKVTLSICQGIVHNMAEMMPPSLIHRAGMTRIIGSGGGLSRNPILETMVT